MTKNINPWKKTGSRHIYQNHWISLREDQVVQPNGSPGQYSVVHFRNLAVGIIPLEQDLTTYLVGQFRYALNAYSWEIPMGGGPLHTSPLLTAKRELKEETGLEANNWECLTKIHTSNSVTDETGYVYLARNLHYGEPDFDDTEDITIRQMPFKQALDMVMNEELTDSLTMAGILKTARLLNI